MRQLVSLPVQWLSLEKWSFIKRRGAEHQLEKAIGLISGRNLLRNSAPKKAPRASSKVGQQILTGEEI